MEDTSVDIVMQPPNSVNVEDNQSVEGTNTVLDAAVESEKPENSDVDDDVILPSKSKNKRNHAVSDSDDDDLPLRPKNRVHSSKLDSDQEFGDDSNPMETSVELKQKKAILEKNFFSDSDEQSDSSNTKNPKKRISRIKSAWISGEDESSSDLQLNKSDSFNRLEENEEIDQSDQELKTKIKNRKHSSKGTKKKLVKKGELKQVPDQSDDENSNDSGKLNKTAKKFRLKPDWMSGEENESDSEGQADERSKDEGSSHITTEVRSSKRASKDGMQKIHSESQRMVRESSVCLPYHKPKQRSLMDFLNRKRVTPSSEDRIKPRPRDLDAVVQVLEDRAKEVEEFFKSESEESENESEKMTSLPSSKQEIPQPTQELSETIDTHTTSTFLNANEDISTSNIVELENTKSPTAESLANSEKVFPEDEILTNQERSLQDNENDTVDKTALDQRKEVLKEPTVFVPEESNDSLFEYSPLFSHKEKVENIKRLSIAKVNKPTLHGRPGQLLDLDAEATTPDQKAKVNNLIERFVQQVTSSKKSPQKKDVQISIVQKVMNADGQLELKREMLSVPVDKATEGQCASAGRRQLLKDSLRQSMSAKRAVDRMKKIENQKVENEDYQSDGKLDSEPEEEILSDEPETDLDEEEDDDEDERLYKEKRRKLKNIFVDEEAEGSDEDNLEDDAEEDDMEVETKSNDGLKEYAESSREKATNNRDSHLQGSTCRSNLNLNLKNTGLFSSLEDLTPNLEDDPSDSIEEMSLIPKLKSTQTTDSSNVDELLALCSGKFPDTQKNSLAEKDDDEFDDDDVKPFSRIIPVSDDEDDSCNGPNLKLLMENDAANESGITPLFSDDEDGKSKPKRKKKRTRICLSDDEDEERSVGEEEEMHEEEKEFRGMNDFFEDEAELSGSEVGSGDEREDEEDDWEEEEGDKEDIDENEVREQVGRAHMKTLLDQDQRDVRLFQELFLEDGDLHSEGGGRQRQFRWKNADGEEIEGDGPRPSTQEEEIDADADQDDLTWRKMRSEREKWLQQQKSQQETNKDVPLVMKRNGKTVKVNTTYKATLNPPEKVDSAANPQPRTSPKKNMPNAHVRRGSFLRRSEKDLSALASFSKSVLPVQAPKMGSNFVFASITPERPTDEKRKFKQEGSKGDSSNQNPAPAKKAKVSLNSKSIFSYF